MKKRLIAMTLSLVMVAGLLAGCGNKSAKSTENGSEASDTNKTTATATEAAAATEAPKGDLPTVKMMVVCGSIPTETKDISAKISEITSKKIGCNVELVPIEIGNVGTQLNLLLSGGDDSLDVYMTGINLQYNTVINNGQALDMTELMKPYEEEMKKALGENVYNAGFIGGKLYGVGHLLDQASTTVFNLKADIAAKYGYKNGDKVTLDQLTDIFAKIRKDYPDTPIIGPMNGSINFGDTRVDKLGNNLGVLANYGQDVKVVDYYESKEYTEMLGYFKKWKEMGCFMPDLLNVTDAPVDYIPAGKAFGCWAGHFDAKMNGIWSTQNFGVEMASLQVFDNAVAVTPWAYESINPASKNPKEAAGLIYLLSTDADVENLLINGMEGVDYKLLEDGSATYVDGKDVSSTGWCMGYSWANVNSTISVPFNYPSNYYDLLMSANKNAKQSKAFGCQFDLTSVSDEVSACTNVVNQYEKALAAGAVDDYASTVSEFQKALKDAGIDKIIAAKQEQLDAFLANK
jgi:ABC-type sugar transport system, periplasmic component